MHPGSRFTYTPYIFMLTLTLRVTQKHIVHPPNKNTPSMCHDPLSKVLLCEENMGYAKRRKEKNIDAKEHERKKEKRKSMLKNMKEKKERDSPYFQNKSKGRESCKKEFKSKRLKFPTITLLDRSV